MRSATSSAVGASRRPATRPSARNTTRSAWAAAMADRILFIADGHIVKDISESTAVEVLAAMQEVTGR